MFILKNHCITTIKKKHTMKSELHTHNNHTIYTSVLIQLIESYDYCVCSSVFIVCFFLIVVIMIFQCEHEHSVCSKAYDLVTET